MDAGLVISIVSLILAILFWWNAKEQSNRADRTLQEIKTQIIGWQNELNKTAIEMLMSRPEMVAKQTMLSDAQCEADFSKSMAAVIERLSEMQTAESRESIESILKHHETIVLEKQRIGMFAASRPMGG